MPTRQYTRPTANSIKSNFLFPRSYNHPRVAGIERKEKCEDPKYQSQPKNSFIYEESADTENITPVNTYYPPATVCYVDPSGGAYIQGGPKKKGRSQKTKIGHGGGYLKKKSMTNK